MVSLTDRAMLVRLNVSMPSFTKHDKKISEEVARQHASDRTMGRYNKDLIDKRYLKGVQTAVGELRTFHAANTLPWRDDGWRVLASGNFFEYEKGVQKLTGEFQKAAVEFGENYEAAKADARVRLNGLYSESDYPDREAMVAAYKVKPQHAALTDGSDFRVRLGEDIEAEIAAEIDQATSDALKVATDDLWTQVRDAVAHMVERLNAYQPGERTGIFRDSLVENIRDLAARLPRMNLTDDARIEAIAAQLQEKLGREEPGTLRDFPAIRDAVAKDAAAILAQVNEFMA